MRSATAALGFQFQQPLVQKVARHTIDDHQRNDGQRLLCSSSQTEGPSQNDWPSFVTRGANARITRTRVYNFQCSCLAWTMGRAGAFQQLDPRLMQAITLVGVF